MEIRKATTEDIDRLVQVRLDYLRTDYGQLTEQQEQAIIEQLRDYFPKHIPMGDFIAFLAQEEDRIVSVAFLVISEKPANLAFINGKSGTVLNVLTYPDYRRKGIAFQVLSALIQEAKNLGVSSINLSASKDGKPLYEKLGFKPSTAYSEMRLMLS